MNYNSIKLIYKHFFKKVEFNRQGGEAGKVTWLIPEVRSK